MNITEIENTYNIQFKNFQFKKFEEYYPIITLIFKLDDLNINELNVNIEDSIVLFIIGLYYKYVIKNYKLAKKYFLMATHTNIISDSMVELGNIYINVGNEYYLNLQDENDYDPMNNYNIGKTYLLKSIEDYNNEYGMHSLGFWYEKIEKNYELAIKYYLMSGSDISLNNLAEYYETTEYNHELAKKYYLLAIEKGSKESLNNLAVYYEKIEHNYKLAKHYYLLAIEKGVIPSMNNLGLYYGPNGPEENVELMMKYYNLAINNGNSNAMYNLGYYYDEIIGDDDLALTYYLMAVEKGNINAIISVGMFYESCDDFENMKKYYEMGIKKGDKTCMKLMYLYYKNKEVNDERANYFSSLIFLSTFKENN